MLKRLQQQHILQLHHLPIIDAAIDESFFLARVDRLLSMGQLDMAGDLLRAAGLDAPERFRRAFDIALLQGTETQACRALKDQMHLAPDYMARVFCTARLGDWRAAAVTLEDARSAGPAGGQLGQGVLGAHACTAWARWAPAAIS